MVTRWMLKIIKKMVVTTAVVGGTAMLAYTFLLTPDAKRNLTKTISDVKNAVTTVASKVNLDNVKSDADKVAQNQAWVQTQWDRLDL
jgi:hypothetical protein